MENLLQDIRYGARVLRGKPGFTAVVVLTLGLGIGANTTVFSVVNGVLLRPLPYERPDELVMVWEDHSRIGGPEDEWASPDNFFDWRDHSAAFAGMFAIGGFNPTLTGVDEPVVLAGAQVSHDALEILGVEPVVGRGFLPEEGTATSAPVVILGYDLWQRRFNGDAEIIGTTIDLSNVTNTVVGVAPAGFSVPIAPGADVFTPTRLDATNSCGRGCVVLRVVGRLGDGVTLQQAQSSMDTLAAALAGEYPASNEGVGVYLEPLHDRLAGPVRAGLWMLLGAVGFVLLIACANVANLMLARATVRRREVAIRTAIGAGRGRIVQQMLTETLLLAGAGTAMGLLLALWGTDLLVSLMPVAALDPFEVRVDTAALWFTVALGVATGLLFGVVPALRAAGSGGMHGSLQDGTPAAGAGQSGRRLRGGLVVAEVTLAVTLLIGGVIMVRSFASLIDVDPGFDADNVLTQQMFLPPSMYDDGAIVRFVDELEERVATLPGVIGTGVTMSLPLSGANADSGFLIEGRVVGEGERAPVAWERPMTPGYAATFRLGLVAGRWLQRADVADAPPVVMINEAAARRYWPDEDPLGARVANSRDPQTGELRWREVVGVVEDTRHFGLDQDERPAMYTPFAQDPRRFMSVVLRTPGDPAQLARAVQSEIWAMDGDLAVFGVATMREVVADTVAVPRLLMGVLAAFAGGAMLLAAIGIYGVMSYDVGQRTREIGLRMALGAASGQVVKTVLRGASALLLPGIVMGLLVAFGLSWFVDSLLFEVSARDPIAFVAVPVGLVMVAMLACYLPARRATRVDPGVALRSD